MPKRQVVYRGTSYESLHSLAEACHVDEKLLAGRLKNGWSVEDAVETGVRERTAVPVIYQGKTYATMRELADTFGLDYSRLSSRIRRYGWDIADAVEAARKGWTPVVYEGRCYPSISALAREAGVAYYRLRGRLQRGWDLERAMETERVLVGARPVRYQGRDYPSIKSLADELKLPSTTLWRKYDEEGDVEKAVERCGAVARNTSVCLWGVQYDSLEALAEAMGINYRTLHPAVKSGEPLEEAVERLMRTEPIQFEDKEYACFSDLCAAYRIQPVNVQARLRLGMPLSSALALPVRPTRNGQQVCYEGEEYPSKIALCRAYGISMQLTYTQKRNLGADFQDIFHLLVELKRRAGIPLDRQLNYVPACIFEGKTYKTVFFFCKEIGLDCAKLQSYKGNHGYSNLFDALRAMQAMRRPVYTLDGHVYTHSQMAARYSGFEIERRADCRSMIPVYPQLQKYDFSTGVDVLELRNQLIQELLPSSCPMALANGPQL